MWNFKPTMRRWGWVMTNLWGQLPFLATPALWRHPISSGRWVKFTWRSGEPNDMWQWTRILYSARIVSGSQKLNDRYRSKDILAVIIFCRGTQHSLGFLDKLDQQGQLIITLWSNQRPIPGVSDLCSNSGTKYGGKALTDFCRASVYVAITSGIRTSVWVAPRCKIYKTTLNSALNSLRNDLLSSGGICPWSGVDSTPQVSSALSAFVASSRSFKFAMIATSRLDKIMILQ